MDDRPPRPGDLPGRPVRGGRPRVVPPRVGARPAVARSRVAPPSPARSRVAQRNAGAVAPALTRHRTRTAGKAPAPRRGPARLRFPKLIIALVSTLVLGLTGYGWSTFQDLQKGLSTADVIGFSAPDGATDILLVGNDSRTDSQGNPLPADVLAQLRAGDNEGELTDTMILVRIPNDGSRAVAISLPRDLYVEMPDGFGAHKLNSAYARAKGDTAAQLIGEGADPATVHSESVNAGRKLLLQTVEDLTGVGIDHYAELNLLGFALLTEAVGGVQVCLRAPVKERASGADFPAGPQTVSGPDALAFVRQRHGLPRGDLDRVVRQQVFLASLADQILSAGTLANPGRIRELLGATKQSLVLDDSFNVLDFASRIQGIAAGQVEFMTVPLRGEADRGSEGAVLEVDPAAVRSFTAAAIRPGPATAPDTPETARTTVDVLNASGITGLAAAVSRQLTEQGFGAGRVNNADARAVSLVRYPTGAASTAKMIADALGDLPTEEDPNLAARTLRVYLGEDYSGPGTNGLAGERLLRVSGRPAAHTTADTAPVAQPPGPPMVASDVPCVD